MRVLRRLLLLTLVSTALTLVSSAASAATVEQIVSLSKAGVSEGVILALIDRDKSIFTIDAEELVQLKNDGVSERIVLAMLKSGRDEAEAVAQALTALETSTFYSTATFAPDVVIVGHGPDRPNTPHTEGFFSGPPVAYGSGLLPVPYAVPYDVHPRGFRHAPNPEPSVPSETPPLCIAQMTGPSRTASSVGFFGACPEALQALQPRRFRIR